MTHWTFYYEISCLSSAARLSYIVAMRSEGFSWEPLSDPAPESEPRPRLRPSEPRRELPALELFRCSKPFSLIREVIMLAANDEAKLCSHPVIKLLQAKRVTDGLMMNIRHKKHWKPFLWINVKKKNQFWQTTKIYFSQIVELGTISFASTSVLKICH